jgi:hypothetical protein
MAKREHRKCFIRRTFQRWPFWRRAPLKRDSLVMKGGLRAALFVCIEIHVSIEESAITGVIA